MVNSHNVIELVSKLKEQHYKDQEVQEVADVVRPHHLSLVPICFLCDIFW